VAIRRNWTEEEVRAALALYLVLDFGKFHSRNPRIMALATRIGRTPSAVALKLSNLAALDASLLQKGMANASALDRLVWNGFLADPTGVLAAYRANPEPVAGRMDESATVFDHANTTGTTTEATVQRRIGQDLFRDMILTSYARRCALTGAEDVRLLNASHIVGWAQAPSERLNPQNGICLNALHDRAFDRHLITFDEDWRMVLSPALPPNARKVLDRGVGARMELPKRFLPDQSLLEQHRIRFHALAA